MFVLILFPPHIAIICFYVWISLCCNHIVRLRTSYTILQCKWHAWVICGTMHILYHITIRILQFPTFMFYTASSCTFIIYECNTLVWCTIRKVQSLWMFLFTFIWLLSYTSNIIGCPIDSFVVTLPLIFCCPSPLSKIRSLNPAWSII